LTPQELLLSRLPGLLSLWNHDRGRETGAYRTARDLVAAWSGLQRLVLPPRPSEALRQADEVIRDDAALLLEAILADNFDCHTWLREVEALDTAWDVGREEAEELEWRTREAFDALDRTDLFAWFAARQVRSDARIAAWLESLAGRREGAERFITDRPDVFLCLTTDLAAVIASSRPGLEETEPVLWETLGKHRRIEEARDEVELVPSRDAVLAGVPRAVPLVIPLLLREIVLRLRETLSLGRKILPPFLPRLVPARAAAGDRELVALKERLASLTASVVDDAEAVVAFDLEPQGGYPGRLQWRVWLLGPAHARERYTAVVAHLPGASEPIRAPVIAPGLALIPLDDDAQRLLVATTDPIRLKVVDRQGAEHFVE
jgi:hypothetical protein